MLPIGETPSAARTQGYPSPSTRDSYTGPITFAIVSGTTWLALRGWYAARVHAVQQEADTQVKMARGEPVRERLKAFFMFDIRSSWKGWSWSWSWSLPKLPRLPLPSLHTVLAICEILAGPPDSRSPAPSVTPPERNRRTYSGSRRAYTSTAPPRVRVPPANQQREPPRSQPSPQAAPPIERLPDFKLKESVPLDLRPILIMKDLMEDMARNREKEGTKENDEGEDAGQPECCDSNCVCEICSQLRLSAWTM